MKVSPRQGLGVFAGYHSAQVDAAIRLNTNESPFAPPEQLLKLWSEGVSQLALNRYPDRGAKRLRGAIADFHGVGPEMVFVANGSNEVIQTILLAYGTNGAVAASFEPTYAMYETIARVTGTAYRAIERGEDFLVDQRRLESELAEINPAVTFMCSPNNPTGLNESEAVVAALLELTPGLVVIDEAYGQFSPTSQVHKVQERDNLVVVRTFSKIWSLAGMRIGYCIGPEEIVELLWKVALPYHLDSSKQLIATLSFDFVKEMDERVAFLISERQRIEAALATLEVDFWPSNANFVLFRPRHIAGGELWKTLVSRGILVRDWSSWPRLGNCLRVTVGTSGENDAFINALSDALA